MHLFAEHLRAHPAPARPQPDWALTSDQRPSCPTTRARKVSSYCSFFRGHPQGPPATAARAVS